MKLKKVLKSLVIVIAILFLISPSFCYAAKKDDKLDMKKQVQEEDGSLFEKIIAECIAGIAQTVMNVVTSDELDVGFKQYDELIFNRKMFDIMGKVKGEFNTLAPFDEGLWNKTMVWYKIFAGMSGSLILIAVIILSYKITMAGMNTARKNEAKESLMRLCFGGAFIALAPLFIRFLIYMNNAMVHLLVTASGGSLNGLIGDSMLKSIKTGNAVSTAIILAMFVYLFFKINIKFIVRQFTIIIFTIFTPIACGLWIINKNVTAASIWAGQLIMNIFMQFIYCFLFIIYMSFLPEGGGWAVSLIWAMMILPLADALQNCFQNLTSRIAGMDNEQMTNRAMGMGAMLGFGVSAIKEQFKVPTQNSSNNGENSGGGLKGFINRAKSVVNPTANLSDEKDYNGNVNPIRNVLPTENKIENKSNSVTNTNMINTKTSNMQNNSKGNTFKNVASNVVKTGVGVAKTYYKIGEQMAEGDFRKSPFNNKQNNYYQSKKDFQNTEYMNQVAQNNYSNKESGDENGHNEQG